MNVKNVIVSEPSKFKEAVSGFLATIPDNKLNCQKAYVSGAYIGLMMAILNAEADFPKLSDKFWLYLASGPEVVPELRNYVRKIKTLSNQKIALKLEDFLNPGLRYGEPGSYYLRGIFNAARVGIAVTPNWMGMEGRDVYHGTMEWVEKQLFWLKLIYKEWE